MKGFVYQPRKRPPLRPRQRGQDELARSERKRRRELIEQLILEIKFGNDSVTGLYARLLAAELLKTDRLLMQDLGEDVAALSSEGLRRRTTSR